ncbi:MAG TPA: DUF4153 domain-containing protein [Halanaerobiales bacterium]|nr:DUF4153 domain-containing protein [Halanaerobiales bacterium]
MNINREFKASFAKLKLSLKRFPYPLIFSTLTTLILIFIINIEDKLNLTTAETFVKYAMALALGFPLFLIIKVYFEKIKPVSKINKIIIRFVAFFSLIIYYIFLLNKMNMVTISRYIAVSLSLYLLFLVIPYFYNRKNFELYVVKIFSRLIVTGVYSLILFAGISVILFTLNELLNIPITETFYPSTALLIVGIFAPVFLLAKIPKQNEILDIKEYPIIFKILLTYIIMPLITIYTTILYIYFIKIIITQQLPQGLVAHLVIWYASLSVIIIFFISPYKDKNQWIKTFRKWLPIALIPLLSMMFLAMYIRIDAYGFTENRYFVLVLGLWILGIALYYIFSKKKNNLLLPLSLSIILILSVFGPWSSYSVSIYSQNQRFENILKEYNMVKNESIIKNKTIINENDQEQIQAIFRYFKNNHSLNDLKYLPDDFKTEDTQEFFGFKYNSKYSPQNANYFNYYLDRNQKTVNIKQYDYMVKFPNKNNEAFISEDNLTINFVDNNKEIIIIRNNKEIYRQSLIPILSQLHQKNKNTEKENLNLNDFSYTKEINNYKIKMIFTTLSGRENTQKSSEINIIKLDFYLLIGEF